MTVTPNPAIDLSIRVGKIEPFHKLRSSPAHRDAGGGGINVARVLKRLGHEPAAIFTSGGPLGVLLERLVADEHVDAKVVRIAGDTREDISVFEDDSGQQFRFVLPGPAWTSGERDAFLDAVRAVSSGAEFVIASGSLPPGTPDDFYADIRKACAGAKFVLDTAGPPLSRALAGGVYLVKPSLRELREFTHLPLTDQSAWIAACRELIRTGAAEIATLTLGDLGALLVTKDRALRAEAPQVEALSTVGAGDSFLGGLISSLVRSDDLETALCRGVAAGTAALLSEGTDLCRASAIGDLETKVIVRAV